ncbi:hypothetical protein MTAT_19990 [Moorella thermoacetica]|uniref:Uncharacterized protein n=1 Tax=Neomoorella thermoacetica TaxID=1525 RepID=A0AAC9HIV9_NEOTH|nr:hypothetical protein [Moorella thermoacetica]AOQ24654.1 hypothetical protein Maut_02226 [Moorella thermoacetica]TYL12757.1 hypothetical protein MTAT_19990 [Moorella thermoacetica]
MATFCSLDCIDSCDFCIHFSSPSLKKYRVYDGDGFCKKHNRDAEPGSSCEDFYCFRAKDDSAITMSLKEFYEARIRKKVLDDN